MQGQKIKFGGSRFAGRFDYIKIYNVRLRPWEIVSNYNEVELLVDTKEKFDNDMISDTEYVHYEMIINEILGTNIHRNVNKRNTIS